MQIPWVLDNSATVREQGKRRAPDRVGKRDRGRAEQSKKGMEQGDGGCTKMCVAAGQLSRGLSLEGCLARRCNQLPTGLPVSNKQSSGACLLRTAGLHNRAGRLRRLLPRSGEAGRLFSAWP